MTTLSRYSFLFLALCVALSSCYDEDLSGTDLGYDYFPVELGRFVEYQVDSSWQDDPVGNIGSGQLSYVLRELNESTFIDEGGREAVRLERVILSGAALGIKDVWAKVVTPSFAEQNEENVIFIKHNFPIRDGKRWAGHDRATPANIREYFGQENIPADWLYEYMDMDRPYTIGDLSFDSTVTVLQIDRPTLAGVSIFSKEVYAKHVGLIHKLLNVYNVQGADSVGYSYEKKAIDFGP